MYIYFEIAQKAGVLAQPHTIRQSFIDRLLSLPRYLLNAFRYNPMRGSYTVDTMIFDHDRHKRINNQNIDIYTKYLIDDFERQNHNYIVLERPHLRRHAKDKTPKRFYMDALIIWGFFKRQFVKVRIPEDKKPEISKIDKAINECFGIKINLLKIFSLHLNRFKMNYHLYTRLFKKRKPKQIILVVGYSLGDLIKAAKDLKIETVELQHGSFSQYHLGYSFPGLKSPLDYFPDKFYVWSDFWRNLIKLPIAMENIINYGFPHLEQVKKKYAVIPKNRKQILILSQGAIGSRIAGYIFDNIEFLKNYRLMYKLHPGEYDRWESYPALKKMVESEKVTLFKDADLYGLMAESYYQIGVYSTALYEGIDFGCKTILLNLPGIEYMEDMLISQKAVLFEKFIETENLNP